MSAENKKHADIGVRLQRLVSLRAWVSPKGGPEGDDDRHKSCFGFAWWFWIPTIFHQKPLNLRGFKNARDIRMMWGCFCVACRIGYDGPVSPKQTNRCIPSPAADSDGMAMKTDTKDNHPAGGDTR